MERYITVCSYLTIYFIFLHNDDIYVYTKATFTSKLERYCTVVVYGGTLVL